ncbi:vitamin-D-receptor interacting mediator subunit 4-domain-containing protein [Schizothecium vesticola]|uniref:Mediator of RNA polymerase II transcription subunit 4 n=1 Tax=Schizothecium vesticola TaxID=314040 RepID=A0AA40ERA7_9PEZI|nr:vitamin-D-receptor interacting mediator subunit 4-domain-containing protein [Schizothecium vesticola]
MDKQLDALFGRVEAALTTLIDSIAKYNPSEKLADDLAHADRALAQGLRELEQHQANHARIQQLRAETAALDAQTKDVAGSLWATRKEVDNTPTTTYPADSPRYPFTIADLLGFARRISRNTLPPPGVTNGLDLSAPPTQQSEVTMDGTATPGASFTSGVGTPGGGATAAPTPDAMVSQATVASSVPEMPMELRHAVNPGEGAVFIPWPTEDKIRSGALAEYQRLVERGMDPKGYDPEEEEQRKRDEEQAKKEAEERARLEHEEAERRMQEERARMARERERARQEAERRGSVAEPVGQKKSQFSFIDMDDEDDDE